MVDLAIAAPGQGTALLAGIKTRRCAPTWLGQAAVLTPAPRGDGSDPVAAMARTTIEDRKGETSDDLNTRPNALESSAAGPSSPGDCDLRTGRSDCLRSDAEAALEIAALVWSDPNVQRAPTRAHQTADGSVADRQPTEQEREQLVNSGRQLVRPPPCTEA